MIHETIDSWHKFMKGEYPSALHDLVHDDCVFYSPIVFSPQKGKDLTIMYLTAASVAFPGDKAHAETGAIDPSGKFRYTKEVIAGNHAVLEFETTMGGKYVNGVDMITVDDQGKIVEFRVMIRPLQAVNMVHEQMMKALDSLK